MQCLLNIKQCLDPSLVYIIDKLPSELAQKLIAYLNAHGIYTVNEIRIRVSSFIFLTINRKNIKTDIFTSREQMEQIVLKLCNGSVYAHLSSIKEGYIALGKGLRAGIVGKAVINDGSIDAIYDISSINIRLPQKISFAGEFVFNLIKKYDFKSSFLLYSPPGVGKTTILRDLIRRISSFTAIRHAVIDTREEITPFFDGIINSDIFLSYPKGKAIEIATKSMSPQIIICDEITSVAEAAEIKSSINSGVAIIATTHAKCYEELMHKEAIKPLLESLMFDFAVGIERTENNKFKYTLDRIK